MKTKILTALLMVFVLFAISGIFINVNNPDVETQPIINKNGNKMVVSKESKSKNEIEENYPVNMTETEVAESIHQMSHQKVRSEDKWGAIPLTQDRVERFIYIVEQNNYEDEETYLRILNKWQNNDFSTVDEDHNDVWHILGGSVGEATGILSPEAEKEYIETYFK